MLLSQNKTHQYKLKAETPNQELHIARKQETPIQAYE